MKNLFKSFFYLFFPLIIGSLVGLSISGSIDYTKLTLPPLAPPKIFFPIAWTIIYILMGISYFIYIKYTSKLDSNISLTYYVQLFINALWSIFFFLLKWRFFSIIWILILDIFVVALIDMFYKKIKISAYLNIPYLLWILFATYLTIGIYILN